MADYRRLVREYNQRVKKYNVLFARWKKGELALKPVQPVKSKKLEKPPRQKMVGDPGLCKGLWRTGVKGTRKPEAKRPGSWRQYCEEMGLIESLLV